MDLRKRERNALIEALAKKALDPLECILEDRSLEDYTSLILIRHPKSGSAFVVRETGNGYMTSSNVGAPDFG